MYIKNMFIKDMFGKKMLVLASLLLMCVSVMATVKPRRGKPVVIEQVAADSVEEQTDHVALRRIGSQSSAPLKAFGSPKVPVILVQFANKKFISGLGTKTDTLGHQVPNECLTEEDAQKVNALFDKFCNGDGESDYYKGLDSYGSIREYFRDQSFGQFTPEFVVIGPVTLDSVYEYYGKHVGNTVKDANLSAFYEHTLKKAQARYSEWSQFDNDNNGSVDMVFLLFAGEGENGSDDENTIWPHEMPSGGTINRVKYGCYAACNEVYNGTIDGIGVFVHELSHALGLPDFYDNNYVAYGMDYWDLMDSGNYCNSGYTPCNYTAYERDFMGWKDIVTLQQGVRQELTLTPVADGGVAYKIVNPANANEYYIIENRQSSGWDSYFGNGTERTKMHGLLVNHVDYNQRVWSQNYSINADPKRQRMTIIPADGDSYTYVVVDSQEKYTAYLNSALGDLFPGSGKVTALTGEQAYVYTATGETPHQMNQPLTDIVEHENGTITLTFCGDDVTAIASLFANTEEQVPVYNMAGLVVGYTDIEYGKPVQLPAAAGVYIVKGKKYIKN